jgi:hypothetical protein
MTQCMTTILAAAPTETTHFHAAIAAARPAHVLPQLSI